MRGASCPFLGSAAAAWPRAGALKKNGGLRCLGESVKTAIRPQLVVA